MGFTGDLQKLPLGDVFQNCHQNGMTGALAVRDPRGERLVTWESGFVTGCVSAEDSPGGDTLARELVRRRVVDTAQIGRPSRFFKRKGDLKKKLTRRNVLNSAEFNSVTRSIVLERIYDCFLLEAGTFEFLEDYDTARFDADEASAGVKINPNEILMEAMRRVDEWARIRRSIPSFREVYVAKREPTEEDDPLEAEILTLTAAGTLDLESVMAATPAARFECCETILSLVESGDVRVASVNEYVVLGKAAEDEARLDDAAACYARGLSYERGNATLNELLISILERLDRKQEAADERKLFAGTLLENGDRTAAAEQYRKAAELVPADPLPRERLLDMLIEAKDVGAAREAGESLVQLYLKLGLGDRAKKVVPRLLLLAPKDRKLRRRMAEVHAELHENSTAAKIYKSLGHELLEEDDPKAALEPFRLARELDPDDTKLRELLGDLETGAHQAKKRRRRVFTIAMSGLLLGGLAGAWGVYEAMALTHLRKVTSSDVRLDQGCQRILIAINELQPGDQVKKLYRGTFASRWSKDLAIQLAGLYAREAANAGRTFVLASPPEAHLPAKTVTARLAAALEPASDPSLKTLVETAERALAEGDRELANATLDAALLRIREARVVLNQSGPSTRRLTRVVGYYESLVELLPRFHLARGQAQVHLPEARALIEAESTALRAASQPEQH